MANWRGCLPAAKHHHHHHHLILRSLLLPVCGCLFPHHHNRWEDKRKLQYRRCGRTIVAGLFGNGRAPLSDLDLHAAATRAASIRFRESHRPDGIKEQYSLSMASSSPCHYTLATKFIDDKLLNMATGVDDVKQIVLLTDGFDTRPYRLKWPSRTVIFDISLESVFKVANRSLQNPCAEAAGGRCSHKRRKTQGMVDWDDMMTLMRTQIYVGIVYQEGCDQLVGHCSRRSSWDFGGRTVLGGIRPKACLACCQAKAYHFTRKALEDDGALLMVLLSGSGNDL
ncbi:hypothetical protein Taro_053168 [Colocasia esculenta]|uniref:S-adenosyl-L-methionine-dependent methyltransferase superfamily protein n=1 Tax=Colocasia esculenta TaxID=4460 RepID=A0A843XLT6_COLES|nr:hypothetical protein [Colocasia esculenta]